MAVETSNFVELNWNELIDKLSDLVSVHGHVKIWSKGEEPDLCDVVNSHFENTRPHSTQQLRLKFPKVNDNWLHKDLFINFTLQSIEYFSKGVVVEILEDGEFWLELNPHVFKVEKRENERLETFPDHQVYAYFKLTSAPQDSNIIFLNQKIEENHEVFRKFKNLSDREILNIQDDTDVKREEEFIGFRVVDINAHGVSFLATDDERLNFTDSDDYIFTIVFNGRTYQAESGKVIYNVSYTNPRASNVSMYKIGMSFKKNQELAQSIQKIFEEEGESSSVHKDFENFAK